MSLSCPFVEDQEPGLTVEHSDARLHSMASFVWCLGQGYQWQNSTGAGQQGPTCCSPCLCRALGELSLLLALPHTEFQAVGRQQLLTGTGEMEGDGCEVNCQTHLPCTGGTMGLSLEQSSPSQAPLASSSNRSARHPLSGKL